MTDRRRELGAGARDVIDHLLVDVPPCAPDEERQVETSQLSETALAIKHLAALVDGSFSLDFTEKNVAALMELGASVEWSSTGPAQATLCVCWRPPHRGEYSFEQISAFTWAPFFVESREQAARNALANPALYAGWNEPPPPEKSAAQLAADAQQARLEAAERAAVLAAEVELATEDAAIRKKWLEAADAIESAVKGAA